MKQKNLGTALLIYNHDFRLTDHKALLEACQYEFLLPVFIYDKTLWSHGLSSTWWLSQSVKSLKENLQKEGSDLFIFEGDLTLTLEGILKKHRPAKVFWSSPTSASEINNFNTVQKLLKNQKLSYEVFLGNTLCEPKDLLKSDGNPYLVFTAFWRNFLKTFKLSLLDKPKLSPLPKDLNFKSYSLSDLLDTQENQKILEKYWKPGEIEAQKLLSVFKQKALKSYESKRDIPSEKGTSKLGPYLRFGEIHPSRLLYAIQCEEGRISSKNNSHELCYIKEIVWREFAYHLLHHFPKMEKEPLRDSLDGFPWKRSQKMFEAWCEGKTGYPIVDAGMRQLKKTGWMHNRVRMIVASFLVKHLNLPWQKGAEWFWKLLVDADPASNAMNWQWVSGCGVDAAPFFRIFNPRIQGEKFDKEGAYIKTWCPELKDLPSKWIHSPDEAPVDILKQAGITLGNNYPKPIVNHKEAREQTLWHFERLKK